MDYPRRSAKRPPPVPKAWSADSVTRPPPALFGRPRRTNREAGPSSDASRAPPSGASSLCSSRLSTCVICVVVVVWAAWHLCTVILPAEYVLSNRISRNKEAHGNDPFFSWEVRAHVGVYSTIRDQKTTAPSSSPSPSSLQHPFEREMPNAGGQKQVVPTEAFSSPVPAMNARDGIIGAAPEPEGSGVIKGAEGSMKAAELAGHLSSNIESLKVLHEDEPQRPHSDTVQGRSNYEAIRESALEHIANQRSSSESRLLVLEPPASPPPPPPPPAQPVPSNGTLLLLENTTWTLPGAKDPVQCVAWRQTGDCSPHGPREPQNDKACNETIPIGASGYCEIIDRRSNRQGELSKVMVMHCDSYPASDFDMKCSDAWEYATYSERSLRYYPKKSLRTHPELFEPSGNATSGNATSGNMTTSLASTTRRGIVFCVADSMMVSVYAAINVMRSKGCTLPIELWYFPEEITDESDPIITSLAQHHQVIMRPVTTPRFVLCHERGHNGKCFNIKIFAVYHTSFESVLLLDTDNFVLRDPTYLFDTPEFRENGAIFWPDFWSPHNTIFNVWNTSTVWELTGVPFVDMHEQESGQLLINRRRHARALDVLMFYAIPDNILYRYHPVYGDKDLFRLAWMRAGEPFHMIQHPPGWAGQHKDFVGFCGNTMVQYDPEGKMLFMHRNSFKLDASEKSRQKIWQDVVHWVGGENLTYWAHTWTAKRRWRFLVGFCYGPQKPSPGYSGSPGYEFAQVLDLEEVLLFHAKAAVDILGIVESPSLPPPPPPPHPALLAAVPEKQPSTSSPPSMSAIRYSYGAGKTYSINAAAKAVTNAYAGSHPSSVNLAWQGLDPKALGKQGAQSNLPKNQPH